MADIIDITKNIPGAPEIAVTLTGDEWIALCLKLDRREHHHTTARNAEEKIFAQLRAWKA